MTEMADAPFASAEWIGPVGKGWAGEWRRTDRSFGALTSLLVDRSVGSLPIASQQPTTGDAARPALLDIGCGAGETSLRAAALRPDMDVTGVDVSADLLAVARHRAAGDPADITGHGGTVRNCHFVEGDASVWRGDRLFDGAMSRHGVMFFADPHAAFGHVRQLLRPGATLHFTCFRDRRLNPWATLFAPLLGGDVPAAADTTTPDYTPGPFGFADHDFVQDLLTRSGWREVMAEPCDYRMVAGAGADAVGDAVDYFAHIGPLAAALRTRGSADGAERRALYREMATLVAPHHHDGVVDFPAAAWVWRAMV